MSSATSLLASHHFYNSDGETLKSLIPFVPEMKFREGWARMAGRGLGIGLKIVTRDGITLISRLGRSLSVIFWIFQRIEAYSRSCWRDWEVVDGIETWDVAHTNTQFISCQRIYSI
jgi:hypothetical protein